MNESRQSPAEAAELPVSLDALIFLRLCSQDVVPGRVVAHRENSGRRRGTVRLLVEANYPDGTEIGEIEFAADRVLDLDTIVLFKLVPATPEDRAAKKQPHLVQASRLRTTSRREWRSLKTELEAEILSVFAELCQRLDRREAELVAREASLQAAVESRVATLLQVRTGELAAQETALQSERTAFETMGGPALLRMLGPPNTWRGRDADDGLVALPVTPCPDGLLASLQQCLSRQGYFADEDILLQALLAVIAGASLGQFVTLAGPPGSGKTSLASCLAKALGAGSKTVPVRPAWIDPTDLLGFYDPRAERYQPTPFLDQLLVAEEYAAHNRLYLLTLDEMNLARIENYAADFLSLLEKARTGDPDGVLELYSHELRERLEGRLHYGACGEDDTPSRASELRHLAAHLSRYRCRLPIPEGLVLLGTVNVDETTYHLSPKFLDRSFVANVVQRRVPLLDLTREGAIVDAMVWGLTPSQAKEATRPTGRTADEVSALWIRLTAWFEPFLAPLGVRVSHRMAQAFGAYVGAALNLRLCGPDEALDAFARAKLLPVVSFHKDDAAVGKSNVPKLKVLEEWGKNDCTRATPHLRAAITGMCARGGVMIRYLE